MEQTDRPSCQKEYDTADDNGCHDRKDRSQSFHTRSGFFFLIILFQLFINFIVLIRFILSPAVINVLPLLLWRLGLWLWLTLYLLLAGRLLFFLLSGGLLFFLHISAHLLFLTKMHGFLNGSAGLLLDL